MCHADTNDMDPIPSTRVYFRRTDMFETLYKVCTTSIIATIVLIVQDCE